jgi:hypothetical protein
VNREEKIGDGVWIRKQGKKVIEMRKRRKRRKKPMNQKRKKSACSKCEQLSGTLLAVNGQENVKMKNKHEREGGVCLRTVEKGFAGKARIQPRK